MQCRDRWKRPDALLREDHSMHPIAGSERKPLRGARAVRDADPLERVELTVVLRRKPSGGRERMTREEFAKKHCAGANDMEAVRRFARAEGLEIVQEHPERGIIRLAGT